MIPIVFCTSGCGKSTLAKKNSIFIALDDFRKEQNKEILNLDDYNFEGKILLENFNSLDRILFSNKYKLYYLKFNKKIENFFFSEIITRIFNREIKKRFRTINFINYVDVVFSYFVDKKKFRAIKINSLEELNDLENILLKYFKKERD